MSWDNAGGGGGGDWNDGDASVRAANAFGGDDGLAVGADADTFKGGRGAGGFSGGCFNCGEEGHGKAECPHPPKPRPCFNCGEEGHQKADCPNPAVAREFNGTCRLCQQQGHRAANCPDAPPQLCSNCEETGHTAFNCTKPRKIKFDDDVPSITGEVAWEEMRAASEEHDLDDFKKALQKYLKATPDVTYVQLETAFRIQNFKFYFIAMEKDIQETFSNMDLQGNLGKKYSISLRKSPKHQRPKEKELWPNSPEENLARLEDAGVPVNRGIPKCSNCDTLGHTAKACPEERQERTDRAEVKCYNCDEVGHRMRDCPNERPDKFACRNCHKSGHGAKECPEPRSAEGVECKKCGEVGHFSKDCPQGGGSGGCRNCGEEGHFAKDCTNERKIICRNCDAEGHQSRECPKPRDYSRVKCSNCQQMGHTKVRCKQPLVEEDAGGANDYVGDSGGAVSGGFGEVSGGDNFGSAAVATAGEDSWGGAPVAPAAAADNGDWGHCANVAQTGW